MTEAGVFLCQSMLIRNNQALEREVDARSRQHFRERPSGNAWPRHSREHYPLETKGTIAVTASSRAFASSQ